MSGEMFLLLGIETDLKKVVPTSKWWDGLGGESMGA